MGRAVAGIEVTRPPMSRSQEVDLAFYFLILIFIFILIYFPFSIFRTLGLGLE